ncbi:MAG: hypothetical protein MRZ91_01900 [Christensenellaceae bacterium]|nr:hypothetical protein [Christensenellaceae bacterium]
MDIKKASGDKPPDRSDGYCDKCRKTVVADERETYERQKREIAGEEIAEMSEDDIRAIKAVMEEDIDKQMADAEKTVKYIKCPSA